MSAVFQCLFENFYAQPSLSAGLTLDQVVCFVVYATCLQDDIVLVQPANHPPEHVPDFLPHLVQGFLSEACSIHLDFIPSLWGALHETVWGGTFGKFLEKESHMSAFSQHGHNYGLSMLFFCLNSPTVLTSNCLPFSKTALHTIYPPSHLCQNPSCSQAIKQLALKKTEARQAILFTLASGTVPVWSVHLVCESGYNSCSNVPQTHIISITECKINYHHNFCVFAGQRMYYTTTTIPDIIQVGEHQFVETKVINL